MAYFIGWENNRFLRNRIKIYRSSQKQRLRCDLDPKKLKLIDS